MKRQIQKCSGLDKAVIDTADTDAVALDLYYQAFIDCEILIHVECGSKKVVIRVTEY